MKKVILILAVISFFSCTDQNDRPPINYTVLIKNSSTQKVFLHRILLDQSTLRDTIDSNNSLELCSYLGSSFKGLKCGTDSILIEFSNGKGNDRRFRHL